MKRSSLVVAAAALAMAACGPAQVVVTAEVETTDPTTGESSMVALSDLELQLIPFDRDAVFDSMAMAFGTPEPEIPQELLDARDEIAAAQQRWRALENRWNTLRDTLQKITEAMEPLSRGEAQYRMLFNDYNEFEGEYGQIEGQMESAFNEFTELQQANIGQAQEVRIQQNNWADEAFAEVDLVFGAKLSELGLPQVYDTTDASGVAIFDVPEGDYYVVGWYEEVYTELYWNVPVTVVKGEPVTVQLTRDNAEVRTKL